MQGLLISVIAYFGIAIGLAFGWAAPLFSKAEVKDVILFVVAIVALPIAVWRLIIADQIAKAQNKASDAALRSSDAATRQIGELTSKNLVDRHVKAVELLAESSAPDHKRVYAITVLNELCLAEPKLRKSTVRVIGSFIRTSLRVTPEDVEKTLQDTKKRGLKNAPARREDLAAALEVLKYFNLYASEHEKHDPLEIDLTMTNLYGANLTHGQLNDASLFRCILSKANIGHASLIRANLRFVVGTKANFSCSDLSACNLGDASFEKAYFGEASASHANFAGAKLAGADFSCCDLTGANFTGADISRADFTNANIEKATFTGVRIHEAWPPIITNDQLVAMEQRGATVVLLSEEERALYRSTFNQLLDRTEAS